MDGEAPIRVGDQIVSEGTRRSTDPEDPMMSDKGDAALRTKWRELAFFAEFPTMRRNGG